MANVATQAKRLTREFYRQDAQTVARGLLGQRLVRIVSGQRVAGLIVETEAYLGIRDKASHAFGGRRTARTETMFADGGTAYVYLNYGIHHLLNVVTEGIDVPSAVLIRAIEPTEGLNVMYQHRAAARADEDLCSGPGKVGAALALDRSYDGLDLASSNVLFIERSRPTTLASRKIAASTRIGVEYAQEWADKPLRFFVEGNPHVSQKRVR